MLLYIDIHILRVQIYSTPVKRFYATHVDLAVSPSAHDQLGEKSCTLKGTVETIGIRTGTPAVIFLGVVCPDTPVEQATTRGRAS